MTLPAARIGEKRGNPIRAAAGSIIDASRRLVNHGPRYSLFAARPSEVLLRYDRSGHRVLAASANEVFPPQRT
jgi:hypothetical protein